MLNKFSANKIFGAFGILILFSILVGCGGNDKDLNAYLASIKKTLFSTKNENHIANFPLPTATTYTSAGKRSPFAESAVTTISPASSNVDSPLSGFMVSSLRFVGTLEEKGKMWGIILTPTNKIYKVIVGDTIGNQNGKIVHIFRDRIEVVEPINEGTSITQRLVTLQLKGKD